MAAVCVRIKQRTNIFSKYNIQRRFWHVNILRNILLFPFICIFVYIYIYKGDFIFFIKVYSTFYTEDSIDFSIVNKIFTYFVFSNIGLNILLTIFVHISMRIRDVREMNLLDINVFIFVQERAVFRSVKKKKL